jgi:hypothetical protein
MRIAVYARVSTNNGQDPELRRASENRGKGYWTRRGDFKRLWNSLEFRTSDFMTCDSMPTPRLCRISIE